MLNNYGRLLAAELFQISVTNVKFFGTMTQKKAARSKALINLQNWVLPAYQNFH